MQDNAKILGKMKMRGKIGISCCVYEKSERENNAINEKKKTHDFYI